MMINLETDRPGQTGSCHFQHPILGQSCNPPQPLAPIAPAKPFRILVLEDMVELAELVAEYLRLQDFEVEVVHDGTAALQLLESRAFHVALVDIDLPDISGFEVVARARAAGNLRDTRIVFCSGGCPEERLPLALQFWGSSFLGKPFAMQTLMTCIEDVLTASECRSAASECASVLAQAPERTLEPRS
jgi:DNA-binding response OmpR family regulator